VSLGTPDAVLPRFRTPIFERAALGLIAVLVVWAPFPLGSNRPWAWGLLEAGIFAAGILWLVAWMRGEVWSVRQLRQAWPTLAILAVWLSYLALHWIPLPVSWVQVLSPSAAELHRLVSSYALDGGQTATLSVEPHASFTFWMKSCAYALAFVLAVAICRTHERVTILCYAIVLSGLLQAICGGIAHLTGFEITIFGSTVSQRYSASGGFVNNNHLAGFLEMSLAVGIGLMIAQLEGTVRRSWRRLVRDLAQVILSPKAPLRIVLVVMVVALVMTRSRMGNTAFFSSLVIAGIVALVLSRHATRSTVILVASLIVVDIFVVGAWFGVEKTVQRIEETTVSDVKERVDPAIYALDISSDFRLFGSGPGTFHTIFTKYRGEDILPFFDFVHNDYVQMLTDTGVIGLLLVGSLPLMALVVAVLVQSRRHDPLARGMGFAGVMGITALGMHSSVDFNLQIPANAFLFMLLLALCWISFSLRGRKRRSDGSLSRTSSSGT
jgi:putative inorganic carbon (HCO3(-)) transporter